MIDEIFNKMCLEKLSDWGVVLFGILGVPSINERLSHSVVADFLNSELEKMLIDEPILDMVVEMGMGDINTSNEFCDKLKKICQIKEINLDKSKRRWRFVLLRDLFNNLETDPVYGLIRLSEFWIMWGWPNDRPYSMQNNCEISSKIYHSQSNYEFVINDHKKWLNEEFEFL